MHSINTINGSIRLKSARKSSRPMADNFSPLSRLFPRLFHQQWALLKLVADQRYPFFSSSTGKYRLRNCIRIMRKLFHRWSSFQLLCFFHFERATKGSNIKIYIPFAILTKLQLEKRGQAGGRGNVIARGDKSTDNLYNFSLSPSFYHSPR